MDAWFVRANGETGHNQPGSSRFVRGEPPNYPDRLFRYRKECLAGGFARVGLPAAGDLRALEWRAKVRAAYGDLPKGMLDTLERFANIRVGDLVVMPADRATYDVHFGIVVPNSTNRNAKPGSAPYYYHYDISTGDWFENAHRVPVQWHRTPSGEWSVLSVPELGGLWRKSFGRIERAKDAILKAAISAGLKVPPP